MDNKEEWNAGITNMTVREGDVHDCDPVRQGHVSAFLVTSSEFARVTCQSVLFTHRIDAWTFCCKSVSRLSVSRLSVSSKSHILTGSTS